MAHIPDGFLSAPVMASTAAVSAAALAVAARRSRDQLEDRQAPLLGAATAFIFAAQMFNFPLGAGTSAHLLGGVLLAVVAGPWAAMLALFSVLLVQALLFQDGGIAALGANTLNLAVLGAGGGYLIYRWLLALTGAGPRRRLAAAGFAAFLSAQAIGLTVGLELGLSGLVPVGTAVLAVGGAHLLVGLAEAGLTVGILALVVRSRPDLVQTREVTPRARVVAAVTGAAAVVAAGAALWASDRPDALESAAAVLGLGDGSSRVTALMPGHGSPGGLWLATGIGVIMAFVAGWALFRVAARRAPVA
jgi:cobalt/nickel transport system permease protein